MDNVFTVSAYRTGALEYDEDKSLSHVHILHRAVKEGETRRRLATRYEAATTIKGGEVVETLRREVLTYGSWRSMRVVMVNACKDAMVSVKGDTKVHRGKWVNDTAPVDTLGPTKVTHFGVVSTWSGGVSGAATYRVKVGTVDYTVVVSFTRGLTGDATVQYSVAPSGGPINVRLLEVSKEHLHESHVVVGVVVEEQAPSSG